MATISQIVAQIRTAIFGKDVRENIAQGIEKCYTDVSAGVTVADASAAAADAAAAAANQISQDLSDNAKDLILVQDSQPNKTLNRIWIKPETTEYIIPTMDDVATVAETATYLGIPELVSEST